MQDKIWFKVGKVKDDIKNGTAKQYVAIMQGKKQIGRIFVPSGSGEDKLNAIQICGFSEAFDLWGCVMGGYKDIQLLFDGKQYGIPNVTRHTVAGCDRCFTTPCCCETAPDKDDLEEYRKSNPFTVKREWMLKDRLVYKKEKKHNK